MREPFIGESHPPEVYHRYLGGSDSRFDRYLSEEVYARGGAAYLAAQKRRYAQTLQAHEARFGRKEVFLFRAPGRLNAFLEYLDMCAGDHMSTTIDGDIPLAFSPRTDDRLIIHNTSELFCERSFSIEEEFERFRQAPWGTGPSEGLPDTWDNRTRIHPHYQRPKGDHANYVIAAFLRCAWEGPGQKLCGGELTFGPSTIPLRAGTSSSSAVVVLSGLACLAANRSTLRLPLLGEFARLLGEAEWYVGTHGGANDHATILCNEPGGILYNRHSRKELLSTPLPFVEGLQIVVANSLWEANKALGANYVFNLRKGWMDLGNDLMERIIAMLCEYRGPRRPGWVHRVLDRSLPWPIPTESTHLDGLCWEDLARRYHLFGSLDSTLLGIPQQAIEELIALLPESFDVAQAAQFLQKSEAELQRDYTLPNEQDRVWRPQKAARFFNCENVLGRRIEALLLEAAEAVRSGVDTESAEYDSYRCELGRLIEAVQATIREDFMVSNDQLELLLGIARKGPGYVGGKLTGAGSGGCVCIFVREEHAEAFCRYLDESYYGVPEHFEAYRHAIASVGAADVRHEMERNLQAALSDPASQRRVVTFSRGAGALALPQ